MPRHKKVRQGIFEISEQREKRYTFLQLWNRNGPNIKGILAAGNEPTESLWALPGGYAATTEWLKLFCRRRGYEWVIGEVLR